MKRKRLFIMLVVLALTALLAGYSLADGDPSSETRYYYQLVQVADDPGSFYLYVERSDVGGTPLHAGSIALAVPASDGAWGFQPKTGWTTMAPQYSGSVQVTTTANQETGVLTDGRLYISFIWHWQWSAGELPGTSGEYPNRQLLGTLTLPDPSVKLESIELLPWPDTVTGAKLMNAWSAATDKEAYQEILDSTWRMPDLTTPAQGYYQGFYVPEGEADATQYAVDLTAYWQGFTIGAYAPARPATLEFYKGDTLCATATTSFGEGTGYFKGRIDFSALALKDPEGNPLPDELTGIYDIVIRKPSHVTYTLEGVSFVEGACPGLLGLHVEIPCGDLAAGGNDVISLQDRTALLGMMNTAVPNDGTADEAYYADLNGDGVVTLADLDILMSAENYNKRSIIQVIGKGAGT